MIRRPELNIDEVNYTSVRSKVLIYSHTCECLSLYTPSKRVRGYTTAVLSVRLAILQTCMHAYFFVYVMYSSRFIRE